MATTTEKPATVAAATNTATNSSMEPNPKDTADTAPPSSAKPDLPNNTASETSQKDGEGSKTTVATVGSVAGNTSAPVSDTQKKIRRAERFGMPVQLSEEEKRNSRAERFGTGTISNGSEASKKSEELKRKARAERFGISLPPVAADEEEKRKARLARFAPYSKPDTVEEDKRKARAIRFSNPPPSSLSQENDKGNIEPKAAIAGKAGGGS